MQVKSIAARMLQGEHSAVLLTFIKLPFVIFLSIFEWPFYTGFIDLKKCMGHYIVMIICSAYV